MIKKYIASGIVLLVVFSACEKENENPKSEAINKKLIAEGTTDSGYFNVKLLANDTLFEGYNQLYVDIQKSDGSQVSDAMVTFHPLMNMTTMTHSAPVENPKTLANNDQLFEGAVVFIMPSNPDEGWTIRIAIDEDGTKDTVTLDIPVVKSPDEARLLRIISAIDDTRYFISLLEPSDPIVGINDIEFTIHTKQTMMSFPFVDDLSINFEPEMPSMGHGSPNNVQPFYDEIGHYKGKVNFTMTGWWRINLEVKKGDDMVAEEISFDVTF